jgi:hypothetical protein
MSDSMQLSLDKGDELIKRGFLTITPINKKFRDVRRGIHRRLYPDRLPGVKEPAFNRGSANEMAREKNFARNDS